MGYDSFMVFNLISFRFVLHRRGASAEVLSNVTFGSLKYQLSSSTCYIMLWKNVRIIIIIVYGSIYIYTCITVLVITAVVVVFIIVLYRSMTTAPSREYSLDTGDNIRRSCRVRKRGRSLRLPDLIINRKKKKKRVIPLDLIVIKSNYFTGAIRII